MNILKSTLVLLFLSAALVSCDNKDEDTTSAVDLSTTLKIQALATLDTSAWLFTNYEKNKIPAAFENRITLAFGTTTASALSYSGKNLINDYSGSLSVKEGTGLITDNKDGLSTLVGSEDEATMTIEHNYHGNLIKASYFEIKDNTLHVYLGNTTDPKTEVMLFKKQ